MASVARLHIVPNPLADSSTIAELSKQLTDGALHCRENRRHDWRDYTVKKYKWGFRRVRQCEDCLSELVQELDTRGLIIKTHVNYAEGYLNPKGTGRIGQDALGEYRLEAIGRILKKDFH